MHSSMSHSYCANDLSWRVSQLPNATPAQAGSSPGDGRREGRPKSGFKQIFGKMFSRAKKAGE